MKSRKAYETFIRTLPAATVNEQWESSCAKVGGKVFALFALESGVTVFKVSEMSFVGLTSLPGIAQAPYFAKGQWVSVGKGALAAKDLKAYVRESHRIVTAKLTRKLRAELGLD